MAEQMTDPSSPSSLRQAAERLLEQITPGDWFTSTDQPDDSMFAGNNVSVMTRRDAEGSDTADPHEETVAFTPYDFPTWKADMEFIAAAPRLVRDLLASLRAHEEQIARLRALVEKWRAEGAATDHWHSTMGTGWRECARELDAALGRSDQP